jgi:hypothetical protein
MKSATVDSFWKAYHSLPASIQARAKKAFELWQADPFYPSLHFKCINTAENIWAVRVSLGYRALGVWEGDTVVWFWIGDHDAYARFFG